MNSVHGGIIIHVAIKEFIYFWVGAWDVKRLQMPSNGFDSQYWWQPNKALNPR